MSGILLLNGDTILEKAPPILNNEQLVIRMFDAVKEGNIITNGKLNKINIMTTMAKLIAMGDNLKK